MKMLSSLYAAWLPESDSPLAELGRRLTGIDPDLGTRTEPDRRVSRRLAPARPATEGLMALLSERLFGDGSARDWPLHTELQHLCERTSAVTLPPLTCRIAHGRLVLAPAVPSAPLNTLIERIADRISRVRTLIAESRGETAAVTHTMRPAVEPHLVLTREMPVAEAEALLPRVDAMLAPALKDQVQITSLTLVGDLGCGRFMRRIADFPLQDPAEGRGHAPAYGRSPLTELRPRFDLA